MLDDILELILELLFDGMIAATGSKKVPLPVRIALGALLSVILIGSLGLLLYVGIQSGSPGLLILTFVLAIAAAVWIMSKIKRHKPGK